MGYPEGAMVLPDDSPPPGQAPIVWEQFDVLNNAFAVRVYAHILKHIEPIYDEQGIQPPFRSVEHLPASYEEVVQRIQAHPGNSGH